MPVFEYTASSPNKEGHVETGRIVARDKIDAFDKLKRHGLQLMKLKKIEGISAIFKRMSADIK
ncbi:MAG TPA: hypothetical protein ENN29_10685 [Candidatus Hydrogenedentes bacterium]|nr:hypothetical protein [Candidatus Hydrogenedentota bacterium]